MPALRIALRACLPTVVDFGAFAVTLAGSARADEPAWRASVLTLPGAGALAADSAAGPAQGSASATAPGPMSVPAPAAALAVRSQPTILLPIVAGLIGAAGGGVGGALVGSSSDRESDDFLPAGAIAGYLAGEALFLPVGVHLGNGARGIFLGDLGASIIGGVCAVALGAATQSGIGYLAGVGAQVGLTVWTERRAASHAAQREASERARLAPADTTRHMVKMLLPPPEPDPLVPPPPPTR